MKKIILSNQSRNTLDVMNYQVSTHEGHYYLQDGYASLVRFAARHNIDLYWMLTDLLSKDHQHEFKQIDEDGKERIWAITMI